jgi:hypothetical protein
MSDNFYEKDNVIYNKFTKKDDIKDYYEWLKEFNYKDDIKATVNLSVSSSFLDKLEEALARVDLAMERLMDYLYEQKSS